MREFVKSTLNYALAMSAFGVQQTLRVLTPTGGQQDHPATQGFNNVAGAAREELGSSLEAIYRASNNLQRGLVDATFSVLTLGLFNRSERPNATSTVDTADAASNVGHRTAQAFRQTVNAACQTADVIGRTVGVTQGVREDAQPGDAAREAGK